MPSSTTPASMKAAVFREPDDLRVEQVPVPAIGAGEVLVKVEVCGICGTDVHIYRGHFPAPNLPLIPGHEFSGRVVEVGALVDHVQVGDHVTADINLSCGRCYFCRHGQRLLCPEVHQIGVHVAGAFAEYVKAPASAIHQLPDDMSPEEGAYVEPLACALHGQERAGIRPGNSVAIIGAGPMGLVHARLAKLNGAALVISSEPNAIRRAKALELGADAAVDPGAVDPVAEVRRLTDGRGADVVFEAVGSIRTYEQAFQMVRRGGTVVAYGAAPSTAMLEIRPFDIYSKELTIVGSYAGTYATWSDAIALIRSGRFDPRSIISRVVELDDIVSAIMAAEQDLDVIKMQVRA